MKLIKPIILTPKYYEAIEKELMRFLVDSFYKKLFAIIGEEKELKNSKDYLSDAIRAGVVEYDGSGKFTGKFNAAISRQLKDMGAKFNEAQKAFFLEKNLIPVSVSIAKAQSDSIFNTKLKAIIKTLDESTIESIFKHNFKTSLMSDKYGQVIDWFEGDFQRTVKDITIAPKLTEEQKRIIAEEWTDNMSRYIGDWTKENITNLRKKVESNAYSGQRATNMVRIIKDNYGVAQNKAKFLARQETALLMSKYRETRYKDIGVTKYKWSTSGDSRVRDEHKHLDGKVFSFDNPPVVDYRTGRRANAGEDFNCRCIARPILE